MVQKCIVSLVVLVWGTCVFAQDAPIASPFQTGFYMPGNMAVRDYAAPTTKGLAIVDYNLFIHSDEFMDRDGNKVSSFNDIPLSIDISGYINSLSITYISDKLPFLGNARYMAMLNPSFNTTNTGVALGEIGQNGINVEGGTSGFGDLAFAPLLLSWELKKFDITAGYMFAAPTGRYETGADDNVGLGYWSHILQAAFYYYPLPEKATAIQIMPTFEFHGETKDIDVTPGSRFVLEYGVSQYLSDKLEIGLQGGHAFQVSEDSGNAVYWDRSVKDRSSVFGLYAGYWITPNFYSNLKWTTTYANRQNLNINTIGVQLIYSIVFNNSDKEQG